MERLNSPHGNGIGEAVFYVSRKKRNSANTRNSYKLGIIFICVYVLSFLLGSAASKAFGAENIPGFTKIANDYVSYETQCETFPAVISVFTDIASFDIQCLLAIFISAFFVFPSIVSCGILIYRGAALGIIVGTAFSTQLITSESNIGVLLFTVPQFLSFASLILCGFSACCFNDEFSKFSFNLRTVIRSGGIKRYIFSFLISLGIAAISAVIRMLCYCVI